MNNDYFVCRNLCPSCNSTKIDEIYKKEYLSEELICYLQDFYGEQGTVEYEYLENASYVLCECKECLTIYQKYIPSSEFNSVIYEKWIDPVKIQELRRWLPLEFFANHATDVVKIGSLFNTHPSNLKFFDFGMGWAEWAIMVKAHGIDSYGLELSMSQSEHAQRQGIKIVSWEDIPNFKFHFINTEQVFEHLSDPLTTLLHLKAGLLDGGLIKISVPYIEDIERRLEKMDWAAKKWTADSLNAVAPLEHINYFRHESLLKMAEIAEMTPVAVTGLDYFFLQK